LAIARHGGAVSSLGKIKLSPAPAPTQYGLGNVGPDSPKGAGSADQVGRIEALNAAGAKDIETGIEGTLGHADLRILRSDQPFRLSDIGAPLEDIGRYAGWDYRSLCRQRFHRYAEARSGHADQRCDGVFKLRALAPQQSRLCPCGVQLRF